MNTSSLFEKKVCSHMALLRAFAMKFTHNLDDSEDLVQETMIKAIGNEKRYDPGTNLRAWLFTIMKNTFINTYRSKTRQGALIQQCEDLSDLSLAGSAFENDANWKFVREDVRLAFGQLPKVSRLAFLWHFQGYKYHEIAERLGVPIGTVKTRIHLARKALKQQLAVYKDEYHLR
ncbi:RNA polymerase subunit sigma [Pedobacter yulinensis]|uniref:RNA polymerase sigma factor n=1 Tax=Pedobacter yulinensis TaxID=2126353 RepID=A0A2T3HMU4_9SPHI|nr:RNA polymerase sigma factor [Pedobacter yulinensis]PST83770.1 RNA polymerase subunit sigma [Pedobacter yulinensis]